MRAFDLEDPEDMEYVVNQAAATLVAVTINTERKNLLVQINEVTRMGVDYGSWLVSVEKLPGGLMN